MDGDVGLTDDDCESRRSKLVPYGLLSSSFHILKGIRDNGDGRCRPSGLQSLFRAFKLEPGEELRGGGRELQMQVVASGGGASMDLTECGTRTNGLMRIAFNRGAFLSVRFRPCIKGQSMSWSGRQARLVVVAVGW